MQQQPENDMLMDGAESNSIQNSVGISPVAEASSLRRSKRIADRLSSVSPEWLKHTHIELLGVLNEANEKSLKELPGIGRKTAICLVMQRNMMGGFKSLKEVQELRIWRQSDWNRFAAAVSIHR